MSSAWWVLVFSIYTASGAVHTDRLYGYSTQGACLHDGALMAKPFDLIKFECQPDKVKPR